MKRTFKKLMAFAMVAVMMANPMAALAATETSASGSASASGDVEGYVDTSVFKVELPTSAEDTFDFIMDPQRLIAATSGEAYAGATFGEGTVFFETEEDSYTNQSSFIEVLNKGTVAVNVSVEATVAGLGNVNVVANESAFSTGSSAAPELYLAFVTSGDVVTGGPVVGAAVATDSKTKVTSAKVEATLPAAPADKYEYTYASGEYSFDLKDEYADDGAETFSDYSFALTGACNAAADWTDVVDVAPTMKVVWTLEDAEAGPANPDLTATKKASSTAAISFTAAANISSASWVTFNGAERSGALTSSQCTISGTKITFPSGVAKVITGNTTVKLTLANGTEQLVKITVQ